MERFSYGRFAGDASQRVHSIVSAAEAEAAGLLRDAEREAELIRRDAQTEGDRIVDDARRRADELVAERTQRIAELSDAIVEQTEVLFERMDAAGAVRRQLDGLMRALGEAAENLAREISGRRPVARAPARPARPEPRAPARPAEPEPAPAPRPVREPVEMPRAQPVQGSPEPSPRSIDEHRSERRRVEPPTDARFDGARLVALQMAVAGSNREEVAEELKRAFRLSDPSSILDDVFGARRAGAAS